MDRAAILKKLLAEEFGITSQQELDRRLADLPTLDISPFQGKPPGDRRKRHDS